jgi:hypothetical protein
MDQKTLDDAQKNIEAQMRLPTETVVLNTGVTTKGHTGNIKVKSE